MKKCLNSLYILILYPFKPHKGSKIPYLINVKYPNIFSEILVSFLAKKIFPGDIEKALQKTLKNPAASSCGDEHLLRVLRNYDIKKVDHFMVEQIVEGSIFEIKGGRSFIKGSKVRTRFKCVEIATKKYYLFSGLYEVKLVV